MLIRENNVNHNEISKIYKQQLFSLIDQAYHVHKENSATDIELCQLINVKTGGCPEDCGYCSQSNKHNTELKLSPLMSVEEVNQLVIDAKTNGVKRMCLGAAYKSPNNKALDRTCEYIGTIKQHGMESCVTLGSLSYVQAKKLKDAGLDYYNHNIDTSPEYYDKVVTTRKFQDRIDTINNVGQAGIKICCGGILGLGESIDDRISFIHALTTLPYKPDSIPINLLVPIKGTPLANADKLDKMELIRTIATVRILFPYTRVRLTAGRSTLSELEQSMCFMAGANSIHYGDKLLTTPNNDQNEDKQLLRKLGVNI